MEKFSSDDARNDESNTKKVIIYLDYLECANAGDAKRVKEMNIKSTPQQRVSLFTQMVYGNK